MSDLSEILDIIKELFSYFSRFFDTPKSKPSEKIEGPLKLQAPLHGILKNSGGFDPTGKGSVGRVHGGVDLRAPGGTPIYPVAPGVVTEVRPDPKGGNTVNVKHGDNFTTYYAHCGTINVHRGDKVDTNTQIATVGASGNAKGFPHLHIQVWKDGKLIDPASVIQIPPYTVYDNKTEKLWIPGAKEIADNWDLQRHVASKKSVASAQIKKLDDVCSTYVKLTNHIK